MTHDRICYFLDRRANCWAGHDASGEALKTATYLTAAACLLALAPVCGIIGATVGFVGGLQWTRATLRSIRETR